ncbi:MAG: class I SAM-dependent methyltransferase [Candidatus Glassbacteria bacterium]
MADGQVKLSRLERKVLSLVAGIAPGRALELAPGRGSLSAELVRLGHRLDALDIAPENFSASRRGVNLVAGNLDDPLPFEDSAYDLVVCCEGIEHLEYQYRFARELARVLTPGGRLVLTTPNINNVASRIRFLFTGFYSLAVRPSSEFTHNRYIEHIYPLAWWQLRHLLHTAGLKVEEVTTDHVRRSCLALAPLWPLSSLFTLKVLLTEPEPRQRSANREICRQLHSPALFFGRTMIVSARKALPENPES